MFVNNWFVVPGLIQKGPREVVRDINSRRPQGLAPISLRDIGVIMTADDHEGIPFQWTGIHRDWQRELRTRIGEFGLVLQLEVFPGEEAKVCVPPSVGGVPPGSRMAWDLELFRHIRSAQTIAQAAYTRTPTTYSQQDRHRIVQHLMPAAAAGILRSEFQCLIEAKVRADVGNLGVDYPSIYRAVQPRAAIFDAILRCAYDTAHHVLAGSPQDFNGALSAWFAASQPKGHDIRTLAVVHQLMGLEIEANILQSRPHCLHLVSAGNAHLVPTSTGRLPLYRYVRLPPNRFGIVDPTTK